MIGPVDVRFYASVSGRSPVETYLAELPTEDRVAILDVLEEVRTAGLSAGVSTRQIDGKLWEIRVSRHRVFCVTIAGPTVVLLHAYKKQSRKAPRSEIAVARSRMKEVLDG